eukprot:Pgem_evm1s7574
MVVKDTLFRSSSDDLFSNTIENIKANEMITNGDFMMMASNSKSHLNLHRISTNKVVVNGIVDSQQNNSIRNGYSSSSTDLELECSSSTLNSCYKKSTPNLNNLFKKSLTGSKSALNIHKIGSSKSQTMFDTDTDNESSSMEMMTVT